MMAKPSDPSDSVESRSANLNSKNLVGSTSELPVASEARKKLASKLILILGFLALPIVLISLSRHDPKDLSAPDAVQVILLCLLWLAVFLRNRISYKVSGGFIIFGFLVGGTVGSAQYGAVGSGLMYLVITPVLTSIFFGRRAGLILLCVVILLTGTLGFLFTQGALTYGFDVSEYSVSSGTWLIKLFSVATVAGLSVFGANEIFKHLERVQSTLNVQKTALEMTNETLEHEVDLRTADYRRAKEEAEQANMAKSNFLASMSHELRTPLNAIIGFSDTMIGETFGPVGNDKYQEYLRDINQSGQHLLKLINDILDLSIIESKNIDFNFESVPLSECVKDSLTIIRPQAEKEQITLSGDCLCDSEIEALADQVRLRQVLINILSNAVKYNKPGGSIEIWCEENHQTGMGRLYVKDTGLGVPEEYREYIFDPFSRDASTAEAKEGTGIGLSITKSLIESMNGKIGFESTFGEGSTFWIDIPLANISSAT